MYTKELYLEFYWQTLFKDDHTFVTNYDQCQRTWTITKRHGMPLTNIQEVKILYVKGINFMEPFSRFRTPRALISGKGTHFCNRLLNNLLSKYRARHAVA